MAPSTNLWYFADPMCSWCWGFTPEFEKILASYGKRINITLMMGGLRPGTQEAINTTMRNEILHHWHAVNKLSGQKFNLDGALPEGFVYDTEPASRAVVTMADLNPEKVFPFFKLIQSSFYVEQRDVTNADTLTELATQQSVVENIFSSLFLSNETKKKTHRQFSSAHQLGVRGFPTLILQEETEFEFLSRGYQSFDALSPIIDNWLEKHQD